MIGLNPNAVSPHISNAGTLREGLCLQVTNDRRQWRMFIGRNNKEGSAGPPPRPTLITR